MITIRQALNTITQSLETHSSTPRLDAEILVSAAIKASRAMLFSHPERVLNQAEEKILNNGVKRRLEGEPIAYILGQKEFWSLDIMVTPDVLIPRPETEMLVEWALDYFPEKEKIHLADLGTGSGAIAVAIAHERPQWTIDAVDNAKKALAVATHNAQHHGAKNVNFYEGQWCDALPKKLYHAILGNPPYIASADAHLEKLGYEPRSALEAGEDGLEAIRCIIKEAKHYLLEGGCLVLEHGYDQTEKIIKLMEDNHYFNIVDHPDLAGLPRMIVAQKGET